MLLTMATTKVRTDRRRATGSAWGPSQRVAFLSSVLGGHSKLARILEVSASQPTRWERGDETPSLAVAQRIIALDAVVAELLLVWDRSLIAGWLANPSPQLRGARPLDVLRQRGPGEVIDAVRAEAAGAFA
jgi:transcriptional regulator with XRE-family HTH domain